MGDEIYSPAQSRRQKGVKSMRSEVMSMPGRSGQRDGSVLRHRVGECVVPVGKYIQVLSAFWAVGPALIYVVMWI